MSDIAAQKRGGRECGSEAREGTHDGFSCGRCRSAGVETASFANRPPGYAGGMRGHPRRFKSELWLRAAVASPPSLANRSRAMSVSLSGDNSINVPAVEGGADAEEVGGAGVVQDLVGGAALDAGELLQARVDAA